MDIAVLFATITKVTFLRQTQFHAAAKMLDPAEGSAEKLATSSTKAKEHALGSSALDGIERLWTPAEGVFCGGRMPTPAPLNYLSQNDPSPSAVGV